MRAVFSPAARRDLVEAVRWIARDNPHAAQALRDAAIDAAGRIGEYPQIGKERPDLVDPSVRLLALTGFPYLMVYDGQARPPLVLRVLHGARDLPDIFAELS